MKSHDIFYILLYILLAYRILYTIIILYTSCFIITGDHENQSNNTYQQHLRQYVEESERNQFIFPYIMLVLHICHLCYLTVSLFSRQRILCNSKAHIVNLCSCV